ncbi:MAG TPA: biopolymer transporter ExbD [Oxalicibacterium sp.]|nr:biopolymer transporter ExbD [Oxalicibacterium sp.]
MSFGGFNDNRQPAPMADINVTPMVDVMLVLLVIFILAAPLFTQSIKLDLPAAPATPTPAEAATVTLSVDAAGQIFWDKAPVTQNELNQRLLIASRQQPQPQLQLRADKNARYETIAIIMGAAQANGLTKLGFVTETPADATPTAGR